MGRAGKARSFLLRMNGARAQAILGNAGPTCVARVAAWLDSIRSPELPA